MPIAIIAAAALSAGSPTYLTCELQQDGEAVLVEIAADEDSRRATVSLSTGRVVERLAMFTPAELRIKDEHSVWVIDRVDLDFRRVVTIGEKQFVTDGVCKVTPAPAERAF